MIMRMGISNGNGCTCDVCHTSLLPSEAIKLKSYTLDPTDSTGLYRILEISDMCKECYQELLGNIMHKGRKAKVKK